MWGCNTSCQLKLIKFEKNPYRKMLAANEMGEVKVGRGEGKK